MFILRLGGGIHKAHNITEHHLTNTHWRAGVLYIPYIKNVDDNEGFLYAIPSICQGLKAMICQCEAVQSLCVKGLTLSKQDLF